jgi:predicted Zn-dependent protease
VTETWVATSEGSSLHDLRAETALSALAVAVEDGAVERGLLSVAVPGGAEAVEPHLGLFQEVAARAVERLHARPVREGRYTVVLDPRAAGLALVYPVAVRCRPLPPGEEFEPLPLGARIGPEWLSIGDDPTAANLRTSLVLDHEGTPVSNAALVQNGVVVGRVESRASAGARNASPTGHALCAGWGEAPAPRLINTYLASGKGDLHTMLEGVEQGLYLSDGLSVRIVGNTLRFEPGSARFIRHGELSEPVKCPPIETALYPWLGRLDAVAADFVWDLSDASFERGGMILGAPHVRLVDVPVGEAVR